MKAKRRYEFPRIRQLREQQDITQTQLGRVLGVPQRSYSYYETGEWVIPPHVLIALADYFDVSVDYLLGRTDETKRYK